MFEKTDRSDVRIDLPDELAAHLADASGLEEPPETLAEWSAHSAEQLGRIAYTIEPEDVYVDGETRHEVLLDGTVRHVPCVLDALEAAFLEPHDPVTIRSVDPTTGEPVTFEVRGDDVEATPADAVVSFGLAADLPEPEGGDTPIATWLGGEEVDDEVGDYACPYINAFESRESYREWSRTVDAVTAPLSVAEATATARRAVESPLFD